MVFNERESARPEDVVVYSLYLPVEVGQPELVIDDSTVAHTERRPRREFTLRQVSC